MAFSQNSEGNIATATREQTAWSLITNLRMDPYEKAQHEAGNYMDFMGRNMWLLVPIQAQLKAFFADFSDYPFQEGSSLNPSGVGYGMLKQQDAMKRLKEMETLKPR